MQVQLSYVNKSCGHVAISFAGDRTWELSVVYASPNASIRKNLWGKLGDMSIVGAWLIIGNFKCVLKEEERNFGRGASNSFASWVDQMGLNDLGFASVDSLGTIGQCGNEAVS